MKPNTPLKDIGETMIISYIEQLIYENTEKESIRDDAFFYPLDKIQKKQSEEITLVSNSDMLVSTTDVPEQMESFHMGRKSLIMNLSDLIVKGVNPVGLILSFGLPGTMLSDEFDLLMKGILSYSKTFDLDYIGGDLNETQEIILNPTVFGFERKSEIIYRKGMNIGDIIVANGKFGLTGVGFDILLRQNGSYEDFPKYRKSLDSVLKPFDLGLEGLILGQNHFATASIDSSDGLAKSLRELQFSNPEVGFKIILDETVIHPEALKYSEEFDIPIEKIVLNAGEEFIHLFSVKSEYIEKAVDLVERKSGHIFEIGEVVSECDITIIQENKTHILKSEGYEHFR
ncbi:MAG: Thiamine-monophosphate kinase [Promethearchaeota archaeon]|jgi:thiamine-monophosphate kinase|nr:MAG: Thiamine-monophosphate kinase [Candidatus Lokiarchaeota archaeon]